MNTEDYVSYPIAVALKAAGFYEPCDHYYNRHGNLNRYADTDRINRNTNGHHTPSCSAPHIYQAQKWLRQKKEIFVEVTSEALHDWDFFVMELDGDANVGVVRGSEIYPSYESSLSAGIAAALELIKPAHQ